MFQCQRGYTLRKIKGVSHLLPYGQQMADQKKGNDSQRDRDFSVERDPAYRRFGPGNAGGNAGAAVWSWGRSFPGGLK